MGHFGSCRDAEQPLDRPEIGTTAQLTDVELLWIEGRIERWIRFGRIVENRMLDRRRRIVSFAPDSVFAFVRWAANDFGTLVSRIDVIRACRPNEPRTTVPAVTPGGDVLLRLSGWSKVEMVLSAIDEVEADRLQPEDVCPDYWRHVHNRVATGRPPDRYTGERHRAWLFRRELMP